jgi:hypothetical protein
MLNVLRDGGDKIRKQNPSGRELENRGRGANSSFKMNVWTAVVRMGCGWIMYSGGPRY